MPGSLPDAQTQEMKLRALSLGLHDSGICLLHQATDHRFDLAENVLSDWTGGDFIGQVEADVLAPDLAADFASAFDRCLQMRESQTVSFELGDGRRRLYEATLIEDETGVTTIIKETTETRAREAAVASLLREVSHRSKNLLAIVQSVAMQTAHHSGDIKDFLDKFRGRLHALSSTQDLVTESDWRGSYLKPLISSQLTRVGAAALRNVRVTGDNPLLGPNASLHIGLALHELSANAMAHGALADGHRGHIGVNASITTNPKRLVIEWRETGVDAAQNQREPRFGTLVLERIVPLSVGGQAEYELGRDGVRYRLEVPEDQFQS